MNTPSQTTRHAVWRMHAGIAIFWVAVLGLLYLGMERYLQPSAAVVTSSGSLQIERHRDGHFYVDGSINGQPVRFMVDTGATYIAVTDALAERAGLHGGEAVQFATANGTRMGRLVRAERITAGPLAVDNLTVGTGYTGKSEQDALLGQNFLRQFDVLMRGDALELRAR
ncbi:TIGR02281 family clan AA aspartic protease [Comamonas nitrativorans]|uniref:TIGR02281 family clan AA aspartic protease n=1 Tax=Comamonas nitrativorans TaxID=108437 RepID=A0ABV9GWZ1_9BURK